MRSIRNALTPAGWLWTSYLTVLLTIALLLTACANLNVENQAVALYGTFSVAQDTALELMKSPEIDDMKKSRIQQADARAKPLADALLEALKAYREFHGPGQTNELKQQIGVSSKAIAALSEEAKP